MDNLLNAIRNKYLNATGAERDLLTLIKDKDITQAQTLMQNRDTEVLQAIQEYNPELHRIMRKADKMRKGQEPYRTEKLPRARQKYINEVELFFLLGNPIRWKKVNNEGSDEAFEAYNQFLQDTRFNVSMRKAKRIAGAETECAKLYHIYRDENFQPQVKVVVICKSKGYTLRPLFDLYENLIAFGYGYYLKEGTSTIEHFDIQTPDTIYRCKRGSLNWEVIATPNPTGKINVIYYRQDKAWGGLNPRIDREEDIDSKISDTNNYFADPIAAATGDVVDFLKGRADKPGKMIRMTGADSKFEYINPPTSSAKLYHIYRDENFQPQVKVVVICKSKGYTLRPLFDLYENLIAFGYGYYLKEGTSTIEHFDIQTPDTIYRCKRGSLNWEVIATPNPTGKINVIYYRQDKAWGGLNPRIDREEDIDSKISDTNNYFADPIAAATGDVVDFLKGRADKPGKMIRMTGADSKFEYINPPTSSETQQREKEDLAQSILFDTFTPEFTPEKMAGLGTLSGEAIKRAMVLGYIKRENNKEIYDIAVDREKNLILAIMMNVTHIHLRPDLAALKIEHEFAEPFNEDVTARWAAIGRAVQDGVMSLEKGVELMGTADDVTAEIERIKQAKAEASMNNIIEPTF